MLSQVFFDGMVGKTYCYITSKVWTFGGHSIPTKSISDIYSYKTKNTNPFLLIIGCILFIIGIASLLISNKIFLQEGPSQASIIYCILAIAIVCIVFYIISAHRGHHIEIVSNSGQKHIVTITSSKDQEDYKKLYYALMDCLMDGEKYDPKNNPLLKK